MGRVDLHAGESAVGRSTRETVVGVLAGLRYLLARFGMEEWRAAVDRREFVYLGVCEQLHSVLLVLTRCHERQGGVLLADGYAHATRWRPQQRGSHVVVCDGLAVIAAPRTTRGIHPAHLPRAVLLRRTAYRYGMLPNPPLADEATQVFGQFVCVDHYSDGDLATSQPREELRVIEPSELDIGAGQQLA